MNDLNNLNSSNLESQLMSYAVSEVYLERLMKDIKPEWLINESHNALFEILSEYYLTSGKMPNKEIISLKLRQQFEEKEANKTFMIYSSLLNHKNDLHDNQYTISKNAIESHWLENHLKFAMRDSMKEITSKNGTFKEILAQHVEFLFKWKLVYIC